MRLQNPIRVCVGLLILAAGLLLGQNGANARPDKPKEVSYYAKVEIQGVLYLVGAKRDDLQHITIPTRPKPTNFPADLRKLKDWTTEKLLKTNGRDVRVTGTLEYRPFEIRPGVTEDRLVIVVTSMTETVQQAPNKKGP